MDEFAGSATQLVADVDCTAEGKPLCASPKILKTPAGMVPLPGATLEGR